jgi:hypothetical protein|tara:strand:- start:888 stop:1193 length:306 start_codon:yes stop_codon:yes gene_type:complete
MEFEHKWEFDSDEEMENTFKGGNKKLHDLIIDVAITYLKTKEKSIPVVSIYTSKEDMNYDIMIERRDMIETLEQNLIIMEEYEDYERCQNILKALNYLKSK